MAEASGDHLIHDYQEAYAARLALRRARREAAVAKAEASEAKAAKASFLSGLNHELRTPLNHITGFAGLLREADALGVTSDKKAEYLDHILTAANTLLGQIDAILEAAGHTSKPEVPEEGTDAVPILKRLLQERSGDLFVGKVDIQEGLARTRLSERDVYQIVQAAFSALTSRTGERQPIGLTAKRQRGEGGEPVLRLSFTLLSSSHVLEADRLRELRSLLLKRDARMKITDAGPGTTLELHLPCVNDGVSS